MMYVWGVNILFFLPIEQLEFFIIKKIKDVFTLICGPGLAHYGIIFSEKKLTLA